MCGIVGLVNLDGGGVSKLELERATLALTHRGPDDYGYWTSEQVGLGHRRLSIIDLENGYQPLTDSTGQFAIAYNGELYNFKKIRKELENKGFVFKTKCDTEVILNAYIAWGRECVKRFRGMFAFAIADLKHNEVFIARDQFGIKPLFYTYQKGNFYFASELQAFRAFDHLNFELSFDALDDYFWFQYIPAPKTIFKGFHKLLPAHYLRVDFSGNILENRKYWDIVFSPDYTISENEWAEEAESVIRDSVKKHLVADIPFGAFLSRGIDSSLVVTEMSKVMNLPVKTFSIGFSEEGYSELKYAEAVAKKLGTEHYSEIVKPEALAILPQLVKHYGEPFGDSSAIPTFYVSKIASQQVKMVLSGDGGDEAFAGYTSYTKWINAQKHPGVPVWKKSLYPLGRKIYPSRYFKANSYQNWIEMMRYYPYILRRDLYSDEYKQYAKYQSVIFSQLYNNTRDYELVHKAQYMDLHTYLPYDILTKVDIASMVHSLEGRTPLIDIKVWELASRIPSNINLDEGKGKRVLKKNLSKYFPDEFVNREKMGFALPISSWLKEGMEEAKERLLYSKNLSHYLDMKVVSEILEEGYGHRVWLILFLDEWLNQFNK